MSLSLSRLSSSSRPAMLPYTRLSNNFDNCNDDDNEDDDGDDDDNDDLVPPCGLFPLADFAFWSTAPVSP